MTTSNKIHESNKQKDADKFFEESLKQAKNEKQNIIPDENSEDDDGDAVYDMQPATEDTEQFIRKANAKVLLDTLSPEVSKNEEKKREHKDKLILYLGVFLGIQFIVIFIFIMTILKSMIFFHLMGNDFSLDTEKMLFAFFGTYITSVIVELIYILKYIVEKVFDSSISDLMKIFQANGDGNNSREKTVNDLEYDNY